MWTAIVSLVLGIVKWIFGGRQATEGEAQGKAEQGLADQSQELRNVQKADDARGAVSDDADSIVRDSNNKG